MTGLVLRALCGLILPLACTSTLDAALSLDDECHQNTNCSFSALQLPKLRFGSPGKLAVRWAKDMSSAHKVTPPDEKEKEILRIISEAWRDVPGLGNYLPSNRKNDPTWQMCGSLNWSYDLLLPRNSTIWKKYKAELGVTQFCETWGADTSAGPSCQAIYAFGRAARALRKRFPEGPKFINAFVVNWGPMYPSWANGTVSDVNWKSMPPSATILDAKGVYGYAACDILRVILTQSPNQQSAGICSHMALLGAMARNAPNKAIRLAITLFWTGRHSTAVEFPCSYIYKRQPGLVAWRHKNGSWVPKEASTYMKGLEGGQCTGNNLDCKVGHGSPSQPAGLPYMWSAAAASSGENTFSGSCEGKELAELSYPGMPAWKAKHIRNDLAGSVVSLLWGCSVADPQAGNCRLLFNSENCGNLGDDYRPQPTPSDEHCAAMVSEFTSRRCLSFVDAWLNSDLQDSLEDAIDDEDASNAISSAWQAHLVSKNIDAEFQEQLNSTLHKFGGGVVRGLFNWAFYLEKALSLRNTPSATEEMLHTACTSTSGVALLVIDSHPLTHLRDLEGFTGQTPFFGHSASALPASWREAAPHMTKPHGQCNHVVFLESCDVESNAYWVWSWAQYFKLTKAMLLGFADEGNSFFNSGMLCSVVLADLTVDAEDSQS